MTKKSVIMQKASANRQSTDLLCVGQKTENEMGEAKLSTPANTILSRKDTTYGHQNTFTQTVKIWTAKRWKTFSCSCKMFGNLKAKLQCFTNGVWKNYMKTSIKMGMSQTTPLEHCIKTKFRKPVLQIVFSRSEKERNSADRKIINENKIS